MRIFLAILLGFGLFAGIGLLVSLIILTICTVSYVPLWIVLTIWVVWGIIGTYLLYRDDLR